MIQLAKSIRIKTYCSPSYSAAITKLYSPVPQLYKASSKRHSLLKVYLALMHNEIQLGVF